MTSSTNNKHKVQLKILVISNYYPPNQQGGYEIACYRMVEALIKLGHQIGVICSTHLTNFSNSTSQTLKKKSYPNVYYSLKRHDYNQQTRKETKNINQYNINWTAKHLKHNHYDICYVWNLQSLGIETLLPILENRIPIIYEFGDFWLKAYQKPKWYRYIQRIWYQRPYDKIHFQPAISVSDWFTQALKDECLLDTVYTIENAIQLDPEPLLESPTAFNKILFCGRVVKEKGVETAINALKFIHKKQNTVTLDIIGFISTQYQTELNQLILELGLTDYIRFLPMSDDLSKIYPNYDVLFMPTQTREPFGMVLIEAMHYGLICFASDRYGPKNIIQHEHSGILIDSDKPESWASAFINYRNNLTLIKHIQKTARSQLQSRHSLKKRAQKVSEMFTTVIDRSES